MEARSDQAYTFKDQEDKEVEVDEEAEARKAEASGTANQKLTTIE